MLLDHATNQENDRIHKPIDSTFNLKSSALPADPKNRKMNNKTKKYKTYFVKSSLILKVSSQMDITVDFSILFYIG